MKHTPKGWEEIDKYFSQAWVHDADCMVGLTGIGKCSCHVPTTKKFILAYIDDLLSKERERFAKEALEYGYAEELGTYDYDRIAEYIIKSLKKGDNLKKTRQYTREAIKKYKNVLIKLGNE